MKIETKYDIGQGVWYVDKAWKPVPCPACNQEGIVFLNDRAYTCPGCRGDKYVDDETELYEPQKTTIVSIVIDASGLNYDMNMDMMAEDQFYPTESDARQEATRRNNNV